MIVKECTLSLAVDPYIYRLLGIDAHSSQGFVMRVCRPLESIRSNMSNLNGANRLLYSRREAAKLLNLSVRSVDHLLGDGRLSSVRIGRRRLISNDALLNFAGVGVRERIAALE
jgi:excisionase family DNA binding protein